MIGLCIAAFGVGFAIGTIYEIITWDEEAELEKMKFRQSRRNIKG